MALLTPEYLIMIAKKVFDYKRNTSSLFNESARSIIAMPFIAISIFYLTTDTPFMFQYRSFLFVLEIV